MQLNRIIYGLILCILLPWTVLWGDSKKVETTFYVAVNIDNTQAGIEKMDLVNIYLGKQTLWQDGLRVLPCMLNENNASMKQFIEIILDKTIPQYRAYWKRRLFSGGGTVPRTFSNPEQVVNYIGRTPGAIGLVSEKIESKEVKYIKINSGNVFKK